MFVIEVLECGLKSIVYLIHRELISAANITNGDEDGIAIIGDENFCVSNTELSKKT